MYKIVRMQSETPVGWWALSKGDFFVDDGRLHLKVDDNYCIAFEGVSSPALSTRTGLSNTNRLKPVNVEITVS